MSYVLGLDTGGTFTDAALIDTTTDGTIIAKAKSLTTRQDLSIGVGGGDERCCLAMGRQAI